MAAGEHVWSRKRLERPETVKNVAAVVTYHAYRGNQVRQKFVDVLYGDPFLIDSRERSKKQSKDRAFASAAKFMSGGRCAKPRFSRRLSILKSSF
jgi:hypothetical protein